MKLKKTIKPMLLGMGIALTLSACMSSEVKQSKKEASDGSITASEKIDAKEYRSITIEKNISVKEIKTYKRDGKELGIKVIENPKFSCLTVGYSKAELVEKGTLYGTKDKDGNVQVGSKGDFKVYSFIKYFKDGHFCVEKTYEKDASHYGKGKVATLH